MLTYLYVAFAGRKYLMPRFLTTHEAFLPAFSVKRYFSKRTARKVGVVRMSVRTLPTLLRRAISRYGNDELVALLCAVRRWP
jgi:hypothetical protein